MKKSLVGLGLASLALVMATPAYAGVSEDFAGCDGMRKPKRSDDGMRGEANIARYKAPTASSPQRVLESCNRALKSGKLRPEQTLRRAHIMRARAAAKIQLEDIEGAMADIEAARAAGEEYHGEFFYDRSMGVSLDLLEAIALNDSGQRDEALVLADAAAAKRPYALQVQRVATMLHAVSDFAAEDTTAQDAPQDITEADEAAKSDPAVWAQLKKIDPEIRELADRLTGKRDGFATIAAKAGDPVVTIPSLDSLMLPAILMGREVDLKAVVERGAAPASEAMIKSYALATVGKVDAARAWANATRDALTPSLDGTDRPMSEMDARLKTAIKATVFSMANDMVEARIAIADGNLAEAAALLDKHDLFEDAMSKDLYAAYDAANADGAAPPLKPLKPRPGRPEFKLRSLAETILMRPESERKLIDYKQSRPNIMGALVEGVFTMGLSLLGGVERTSGFEESENADGTIKVEYTGNTTSGAVVQEMTLLRAAEVAQAAGKPFFHITDRKDYQRYAVQSYGYVEQSRTLTGYKAEVTIALLDTAEDQDEALEAVAVIDALGPIYYSD